jgi:glycosyltransferase involved in cell wall biosynthesis
MYVLHIIAGLNVGGAELMLKRLVEPHDEGTGYRHAVISLTDIGTVGRQLQTLGVEVQALNMRSAADIPRTLWQLVRMIRASRPDVVQTWMYHADLLGGLAARIAGNRNVIWGIRTTEIQSGGSRITSIVRNVCAVLSRQVPHKIVCAAEASRRVHMALGYDAPRMVVIPNGFDLSRLVATPDQRAVLRARCGFSGDDVVVGSVGRFHPVKDQENFVRAAGLLAQQHTRVRFLMIGRGLDAQNRELVHWIQRTGHPDRFMLLGERTDVPTCLAAMDIFCLSSRTEGFPNVVGEAMAMGLPCVVTNVGDAAMLVAATGVVVPKEDPVALAQGLTRVLEMAHGARQQLGHEARARICAEFTIAHARERFEAIYACVTGKGSH